MFEIIKPGTQFDFAGKRHLWMGLSVLAIVGTLALLFTRGLNFGVDFTGGAEIQIRVPSAWTTGQVREVVSAGGLKDARVVAVGEEGAAAGGEYLVRVQGDEKSLNLVSGQVEEALKTQLQPGQFEIQRVDVVGPAAGGTLREKGVLAVFYALLAILIYVAVRFDARYAPGAVMALFHDAIIVLGIFILTQKQFDLTILAAILALVGYSNNDTIIVYDRVRETLQMHPELTIEKAVNRAVNETLGRTLMTSITTFVVALALFVWGGPVIHNFAFTFMVGIIVGTYSSIFIASSFVITLTHRKKKRELQQKMGGSRKTVAVRPEPKFQ